MQILVIFSALFYNFTMNPKPIIHAGAASLYIIVLSLIMTFIMKNTKGPDTVLAPITALSVFTLSAAVMGYLFVFEPLRLYLEGKKKEGIQFFFQTVAVFAGITAVILLLVLSGIFS